MSTAAFDAVAKIPNRIAELNSLTQKARSLESEEEMIYNAICRSCSVLIASHIEGAVKDICEGVRNDLNYYLGEFKLLPTLLKRDFCLRIAFYEGVPSDEIEKRVKQLISFFEKNSVPVELDSFKYLENNNKNPTPGNIDKPFEKFGVKGALSSLNSGFLLHAFSDESKKLFLVKRTLTRRRSSLFSFPYTINDNNIFNQAALNRKDKSNQNSLWHTFFEEIVTRRHKIAHGEILENPTTVDELEKDILKAEVALYSLAFFFCERIAKSLNQDG